MILLFLWTAIITARTKCSTLGTSWKMRLQTLDATLVEEEGVVRAAALTDKQGVKRLIEIAHNSKRKRLTWFNRADGIKVLWYVSGNTQVQKNHIYSALYPGRTEIYGQDTFFPT